MHFIMMVFGDPAKVKAVLMTGAASGIGRAMALHIAAPGVSLHLGDVNIAGIEETAAVCRAKGAEVMTRTQDVRDAAAMDAWISSVGRLDLVIGCAGVQFTSLDGEPETEAQVRVTMDVNFGGSINTALPAERLMSGQTPDAKNRRGQIMLMASLGAFVSVPGACTYTASKAAVDNWVVGRSALAKRRGVYYTSVCPGYVRTPLTSINDCSMHGLMEPDYAAGIILKRLDKAPVRIAFPWRMVMAARFGSMLPAGFPAHMLAHSYSKRRVIKQRQMSVAG